MSRFAVIIVAGGKGSRFGSDTPKQFLQLGQRSVLEQTVQQFFSAFADIEFVVVLPQAYIQQGKELLANYSTIQFAVGGDSRFQSVKNGLQLIQDEIDVIGVHDAVRPLVSKQLIQNSYQVALLKGNAVPAVPIKDSLRKKVGESTEIVSRENLYAIQTPQCFKAQTLLNAYNVKEKKEFTDDASVVEHNGHSINLIHGEVENIKITTPPDLVYAEFIFAHRAK